MPAQKNSQASTPITDALKRSVIPNIIDHPDAYYAVRSYDVEKLETQNASLADALKRLLNLWDNDYLGHEGDGKERCNHAISNARNLLKTL